MLTLLAAPRAAPLERLKLAWRVYNAEAEEELETALTDVFVASPALTSLSLEMFVGVALLYGLSQRATAARGGVRPALRELRIMSDACPISGYETGYECGMFAVALSRLGTMFPALTTLAVASLHGLDVLGEGPWTPMAALRSLCVANLGESPFSARTTTSAQLSHLLSCIAAAAPNLELLDLRRGEESLSTEEVRAGVQTTPLPSVGAGAGGVFALQQLRELKLSYVHVSAADAANAHLPLLRKLGLFDCGAHAAAAGAALAAAAPALESLCLMHVPAAELDGTAGPGVSALSALSHGALCKLSVYASTAPFPRTARGATAKAAAEVKAAKALSREVKALATRKALPALRSLWLGAVFSQPMPPCFVAAHPWPQLRSLSLRSCAEPDSIPACLAGLRAPELTTLSLPNITDGVASVKTRFGTPPTKDVVAAYEALRTSGRAPKLTPLRKEDAK